MRRRSAFLRLPPMVRAEYAILRGCAFQQTAVGTVEATMVIVVISIKVVISAAASVRASPSSA